MKRKADNKGGPPPHWVLQSLQEEPDSLPELWAEHRQYMATHIPNLVKDAVIKISAKLQEGGLSQDVANLIAESMPCVYLNEIEYYKKQPRNKALLDEMDAIQTAAYNLQRALIKASGSTLGYLRWDFMRPWHMGEGPPQSYPAWKPLPETEEVEQLENAWTLLFGGQEHPGLFLEETRPNPRLLSALGELGRAAKRRKARIPKDKGGRASGDHDPFGARAREWVALEIHQLLRYLNLPCGTQKDGPVAEMLEWVHEAANLGVLLNPDKATERVRSLEKKLENQGSRCEWP